MSLVQEVLEPDLLAWLQADPSFADVHELSGASVFNHETSRAAENEKQDKFEESGYVRDAPPKTQTVNGMSAKTPCRSERVR